MNDTIKAAADKGPVYVLMVAGGLLLAGVEPSQIALGQLTGAEFITANIVGALLIISAGIISLLATQSVVRGLEGVSAASSKLATQAAAALGELAKQTAADDATVQNHIVTELGNLRQAFGSGEPASPK